ncbi:MAG: nuclear transport factor 2 family protein [Maritimibacter sp.]|uniref:nuclear transport factor 2 family protein n=1 Tax=Maritimibacter sp. TaxID=2003363 RepID=UPI001DD30544|nr:nuclear transport factor 2 family protein [Maritimibacter sp.]MBL6426520.1 nuclear transport factor 2 family protein [Maritimibacter sp.]
MNRATFDDYIARFNARDPSAFEEYIADDMEMLNGALRLTGVAGMKDHYQNKIWPDFDERLNPLRFIGNDDHVAIEMRTEFEALADNPDTLFGAVRKGEMFVYHGLIMYDLRDGRFTKIQVAYNRFTNIKLDGTEIEMGLPH